MRHSAFGSFFRRVTNGECMSSNDPRNSSDKRRDIDQELRRLDQKYEAERKQLLQQAQEEGLAEKQAEMRAEMAREVDAYRAELASDTPAEEAARARRTAPSRILLLLLLFLILYLFAVATGRSDIISFPRTRQAPQSLEQQLGTQSFNPRANQALSSDNIPPYGSAMQHFYPVGDQFQDFYNSHGGEPVFGRAISPQMTADSGRIIQWFERTRLEDWPENPDPYKVMSGRVGVEYTADIQFPEQTYFVSRPGLRYFVETHHGVRADFLQFWEQHGLDILGFPISEEIQERLPDGQVHRVQYFERARLEHHPEYAGTPDEVQIGLLGTALYIYNSKPDIIPPVDSTPVPTPPPPTPTPVPAKG